MIIEIYKKTAAQCGGVSQAIKQEAYTEWTPERIKAAFNFGNGTEKDLKNHMDNNKSLYYFIEI